MSRFATKPSVRIAVRISGLLLVGAALNVSIAIGLLASAVAFWGESYPPVPKGVVSWPHPVPMGWPVDCTCSEIDEHFAATIRVFDPKPATTSTVGTGGAKPAGMTETTAGWPFRSFIWWHLVWDHQAGVELGPLHGGWDYGHYAHEVIPYRPLWPGFVLNTLVYALIVLAVSRTRLAIHRWRCRRANRCVKCGYDRAGLAIAAACPECGTLSQ